MNYQILQKLPDKQKLLDKYPVSTAAKHKILQDRQEIKNIISGNDDRLIIIVGPCSAWPAQAVIEYAHKLQEFNQKLHKKLKIIMRMYTQKSRTTNGWAGAINQPNPFLKPNLEEGLYYSRKMMLDVINLGLPIADECLFTHNSHTFEELLSWFAIGARSSENHEHRIFASKASCPVGMKNPTHGALEIAINSVIAAQSPHIGVINNEVVQTFGNPYAHLVLRGSDKKPNYSLANLVIIEQYMRKYSIQNPAVIIDASHDNSYINNKKNPQEQISVILNTLKNIKDTPKIKNLVKGFMIESYLKAGNQNISSCDEATIDLGGLSITDPCLGWDDTKNLLNDIYNSLTKG